MFSKHLLLLTAFLLTLVQVVGQDSADYRMLKKGDLTAFEDGVTARAGVRANFYLGSGDDPWANSPGQVAIEYGLPVWKAEYDQLFQGFPVGKQWRMGSNFWTNLWTSFRLGAAGGVIQPGFHFLVLERTKEGWNLVVVNPQVATKAQMDPWHVGRKDALGGSGLPLQWEKGSEPKDKLEITIKVDDEALRTISVHIRFGGHHFWTAPITVSL
jgi:hypothetical protein